MSEWQRSPAAGPFWHNQILFMILFLFLQPIIRPVLLFVQSYAPEFLFGIFYCLMSANWRWFSSGEFPRMNLKIFINFIFKWTTRHCLVGHDLIWLVTDEWISYAVMDDGFWVAMPFGGYSPTPETCPVPPIDPPTPRPQSTLKSTGKNVNENKH